MDSQQLIESFGNLLEEQISDAKAVRLESLSSLLLLLKERNRELYCQLKEVRKSVQQERSVFDERSIALQSVHYERDQVEKEIIACQAFPTRYQNLDLVPMEEYQLNRRSDPQNDHELMLDHLQHELETRRRMVAEVKEAEKTRDSCMIDLQKKLKELEALRDNAKTIYKMACSYNLVEQPVKQKIEMVRSPLQRLFDELRAFAGDREGWELRLLSAISASEEQEEGQIAGSEDVTVGDDEGSARHEPNRAQPIPRHFDFEYIELIPSAEICTGALFFHHALPSDPVSPILSKVSGTESLLPTLPLDASMALTVPVPEGSESGLAYKWVQVVGGLDTDVAFADGQRCITAFFNSLKSATSSDNDKDPLTMDTT